MADDQVLDDQGGLEPLDLSGIAGAVASPAAQPVARAQPPGVAQAKNQALRQSILATLIPFAARSGGPRAVAALMQGYQKSQAGVVAQRQQQMNTQYEQQRQADADARATYQFQVQEQQRQQAAQLQQAQFEQNRRVAASNAMKDFAAKLSTAETKEQIAALADSFRQTASILGVRPAAVEAVIAKASPTSGNLLERSIRKHLDKLTPEQINEYLQGNASLQIPGQELPIPVSEWSKYVMVAEDPLTGAKSVAIKKPDVANTSEEKFLDNYAKENGFKNYAAADSKVQAAAAQKWAEVRQDPGLRDLKIAQGQAAIANAEALAESRRENAAIRRDIQANKEETADRATELSARSAKASVEDTMQEVVGYTDDYGRKVEGLLDEKGNLNPRVKSIAGANYGKVTRYIPGSDAANAQAQLDRLRDRLIVDLIGEMKSQSRTGATGFGQLSENELALIRSAAAKLSLNQSPLELENAIRAVKKKLDLYRANADAQLGGVASRRTRRDAGAPGAAPSAAPAAPAAAAPAQNPPARGGSNPYAPAPATGNPYRGGGKR